MTAIFRFSAYQVICSALALAVCGLAPLAAHAQANRTWVSGVGDDVNPCSRTAPCKTWAGAISKTAAGGEIDALDPGGFGAVIITKSITLDGGAGQVAGVLVGGASNGINVNAGATDNVILRNFSIHGDATALNGIVLNSAATLRIQNMKVDRFTTSCVAINPTSSAAVEVMDTVLTNCGTGLSVNATLPVAAKVSVERSRFLFNTTAGVAANGSGAVAQLSNSTVFGNATGLSTSSQGTINTFGNNQTLGNSVNGTFSGTAASN